ncbi:MAG: hypothetical protein KTR31_28055 [Myxococcales bacterium]|nr:hypothetical protein [Myxococcales bacterium]
MSFDGSLGVLVAGMDAARHAVEIERLRACRSTTDLDAIVDGGGWLSPESPGKRLKLVRHGSGTYLVVEYDDGWSTRVSQAPFR